MRARRRTPVRPARGNRWRLMLRDAALAAPDTLWRPIGRLGGPSLPSIAAWQSPVCTPRATGLEVSPEAASAHRQCGLVHDVPGPRVPCAELACGEPMRAHIGESGWPRVSPATPRFQRTHGGLTGSRSWASGADRLAAAPGVATRTHTRLQPTAPGRLPHRRPGAGIHCGEALAPQCSGQVAGARDPRGDRRAPVSRLGARNPRSSCALAGAVEASCGLRREGGAGGVVQVAGGGTVGGASGSRAPAGRLTVNVLPTPTSLLNATCPPWLLTMRSAIVRPRPVPGVVDSRSGTR